jgi:glycerate kinase
LKTRKPIHLLIAMDSFKGSASSLEVASFVKAGVLRVQTDAQVTIVPVADGGEGTVEALVAGLEGRFETVSVSDPLGKPVLAKFGIVHGNQAVLEMAAASGLTLIAERDRDPFKTSTFGTGEMLLGALEKGVERVFIGLGGSATNDGGVGMAQALGISFLDKAGREIGPGAAGVANLNSIHFEGLNPRVREVEITALTDVNNPLCGENGASRTFGMQKGASPENLEKLDKILRRLADVVEQTTGKDFSRIPGAGAAGGLGFGLLSFCGAAIQPGIETVLDLIQIDKHLKTADCVITGEGRMDNQSLLGKAPVGIALRAKKYGLPVIAIVGSRDINLDEVHKAGIDLVLDIINAPMSLKEAMENTPALAQLAGENAIRAYLLRCTE